jgi:hypothetical protein
LDRLWEFVLEFRSITHRSADAVASIAIDEPLKHRVWKLLLRHPEVLVCAGEELIHSTLSSSGVRDGTDPKVSTGIVLHYAHVRGRSTAVVLTLTIWTRLF